MYRPGQRRVTRILCCKKVCAEHALRGDVMNYNDEKKYVGNRDQLFQIKKVKLQEGKARGVTMLEVANRSGMQFDVNADRGMDIPFLSFNGENFGYISPCGVAAPEYFDDQKLGFLKSFTAGFLTTCGLKIAGAPCEYEGKAYGLHGNVSHIPAKEFRYELVETDGSPYIEIQGSMQDAEIFQDKLTLKRNIRCGYREKEFTITDRVTNEGYKKARHMILYHCNIGYPILSPASEVYIPSAKVTPRTEHAKKGLKEWYKTQQADPDYEEMCYYHKLIPDGNNHGHAAVYNPELNLGIEMEIDLAALDHFVQWKMMGAGEYVMGLEPANATIDGIEDAIKNGSMKYLEPGESAEYRITFRILEGREAFENIKV